MKILLSPTKEQLPMFQEQAEGCFSAIVASQAAVDCPRPVFDVSQWSDQEKAVYEAMKHGRWMTKAEISFASGATEHAVSARLSELKKRGIFKEKRKAKEGKMYEYRIKL